VDFKNKPSNELLGSQGKLPTLLTNSLPEMSLPLFKYFNKENLLVYDTAQRQ
jgi:hypothetical protein